MLLTAGARLGPYEVVGLLGAGGMGEGYEARDTRLDRSVAIKVLSAEIAGDPDLRARFEREARAVAALDHPNICGIYDVGEANGTHFIVMPHLDGQTLAARLEKGALPLDQTLTIAIEIADALDKTHRRGITHRDLKPANIMLVRRGGPSGPPESKLLDFGLAKLKAPAAAISMSGITRLATINPAGMVPGTGKGVILGTVQYMSPEQVEGSEADARSDIWALGAVIYEMATGTRPFRGDTPASVIGSILKDVPPPVSARQPLAPRAFDHIVGRCLEKDPDERWQTAADLMRELRWVREYRPETVEPARPTRRRFVWAAVAMAAIAAAGLLTLLPIAWRPDPAPAPVLRFSVSPPAYTMFARAPATLPTTQLALSPDGQSLAFVGETVGGDPMVWIRRLDTVSAQAIAATEDASYPFWSPDSRAIAFFAKGKLKKVFVGGGAPETLCDVGDPRGGAWGPNEIILFSGNQTPIMRVSADGGVPVAVTTLDPTETGHRWPNFLPDGRHFLYYGRVSSASIDQSVQYVTSLDEARPRRLFVSGHAAVYAPSGHLLFLSNGMLLAQRFDPATLTLSGEPSLVARDVSRSSVNYPPFTVSSTGMLAFAGSGGTLTQLAWVDRKGTIIKTVGPAGDYADPALSPDNKRALVTRVEPTGDGNIWTIDLATDQFSPLTFDPSISATPVWSPDGTEIVFRTNRTIPAPMFRRLASGGSGEQPLLSATSVGPSTSNLFPNDWSPDGNFIAFHTASPGSSYDIWMLPLAGDRTPRPFVKTPAADLHARFSPDGRFLAYSSAESGRTQVYVQPFPGGEGRWQVSIDGGSEPRWRGDGRELFFIGMDRRVMAIPVEAGPSFQPGQPVPLFVARAATVGNPFRSSYAVSRDGQRFLINGVMDNAPTPSITVVANWPELLKK